MRPLVAASLVSLSSLFASTAMAEPDEKEPDRWEPGGFPVVNYDSNLGVGLGAIGVLARFERGYEPYRFRLQALAQFNIAQDQAGNTIFPLHDHYFRFDAPGLLDDRVRLQGELSFNKLATTPYYGIGQRSEEPDFSAKLLEQSAVARRYNHYDRMTLGLDLFLRFALVTLRLPGEDPRLELYDGTHLSSFWIDAYPGSKLKQDVAEKREPGPRGEALRALLHGTEDNVQVAKSFGLLWDDRDHEFAPSRGSLTEIGVRLSPGVEERLSYSRFHVATRWFAPLVSPYLVFANRLAFDVLGGDPPVDELSQIGVFQTEELGGGATIRGVPLRRFSGRMKLLGQAELRGSFPWFVLFEQRLQVGVVAFVDAARVWADYEPVPALDVDFDRPPFAFGTGGGARFRWADTFILRADGAYSPTEDSTGIYVDVGHAF